MRSAIAVSAGLAPARSDRTSVRQRRDTARDLYEIRLNLLCGPYAEAPLRRESNANCAPHGDGRIDPLEAARIPLE
jgi:hypothetical protein